MAVEHWQNHTCIDFIKRDIGYSDKHISVEADAGWVCMC